MARAAKEAKVNRESLYKALSEKGNPSLTHVKAVLGALAIRLELFKE